MSASKVEKYLRLEAELADLHARDLSLSDAYDVVAEAAYDAWQVLNPDEEALVSRFLLMKDGES